MRTKTRRGRRAPRWLLRPRTDAAADLLAYVPVHHRRGDGGMVDGMPRRLQDLWNGHDPNAFPPARFASTTRETRPRRLDDGQSGSGCQGVDQLLVPT